jgi:hypothetical protein
MCNNLTVIIKERRNNDHKQAIAIARQIFQNKIFFSLPGEVFLIKKKKKSFFEKFAGRLQ